MCDGDGSGLTSAASNSIVSFCSSGNKCEYVCNSGYTKQGNACVGSSAQNYSCVGTAPQNATLCSGDETGLAWDSLRTLVISCSPDVKCEYTCSVGYEKQSTSCVAVAAPPAADTCTVVSTVNLMGLKVAVASPTDINASVSPQAEKSAVFVIFDNNVFVENAVNPYASVSGDVTGDVATWLK